MRLPASLSRAASALAALALGSALALVAVPASAAADVAFTCKDAGGSDSLAELSVGFGGGANRDDYFGPLDVSYNGGDTWSSIYTYFKVLPPFDSIVHNLSVGGDTTSTHPYMLRWVTDSETFTCNAMYYPIAIDARPSTTITRGDSIPILATMGSTDYRNISRLTMVAYVKDLGAWKPAASARVSAISGASLANLTPAHSTDVQLRVFDDAADPGHTAPIGLLDLGAIVVNQPTPYLEIPSTVYAGKTATLRGWYGTVDKGYTAILERWTGDYWEYVDDANVDATIELELQWKPTSTAKYRLRFYGIDSHGDSKLNRTQYFTVNTAYKVTATAPVAVKRNNYATFTVTHKLAVPFTAYLQRWSGTSWVTVKTFVPNDTATKVSAKVTSTSKWRVLAAGYVSKTVTIKAS